MLLDLTFPCRHYGTLESVQTGACCKDAICFVQLFRTAQDSSALCQRERGGSSQDMWFIGSHWKCFLHCKCPDILTPLLWKFPRPFLCQPKTLYDLCFLCNTAVGSVIPGGCGWHLIYCSFFHLGKSSDFIAASRTLRDPKCLYSAQLLRAFTGSLICV